MDDNTEQAQNSAKTGDRVGCSNGVAALNITWQGGQHSVQLNSARNLTSVALRGYVQRTRSDYDGRKDSEYGNDDSLEEYHVEVSRKGWKRCR
jgi:hypothetical protein